MAGTVVINQGYRLRDLLAGAAVVQMAVAFVHALRINDFGPDIKVPAVLFVLGLIMLTFAFGAGAVMDRLTERFPTLIRRRECPKLLLMAIFLSAVALALRQEVIAGTLLTACQAVGQEASAMWTQMFA